MRDDADYSLYPGILGVLAHAGYKDDADKLAKQWGGTKRYIPANPADGLAICSIISLDAARVLASSFGGSNQDIPRMKNGCGGPLWEAKKKIIALEGESTRNIAKLVGCSERYVRIVKKEMLALNNGSN